jgi:hypothetical protein
MSEKKASREEELKKEGWVRQFTTDEPRLSEAVELYESIGVEVRLEPWDLGELEDECDECLAAYPERFKTIYTRKKKDASED